MFAAENISEFGTAETPAALRLVQIGHLSFLYGREAIRQVRWRGTELVRAVSWPVRDENWGTYQQTIVSESVDFDTDNFRADLRFSVADGRLQCELAVRGSRDGELTLEITLTPRLTPFATNRAGFTVLHPIKGIAGSELEISHSAGEIEKSVFPRSISPDQPVMDIHGLKYTADGQTATIKFFGETFEMEDQRNWSDASYKTYCVPLVFPFTYELAQPATQSLKITLSGESDLEEADRSEKVAITRISKDIAPAIGMVVEPGWIDATDAMASSGASHIRIRLSPESTQDFLERLSEKIDAQEIEIELAIDDDAEPSTALAEARQQIEAADLNPVRITALRAGYLKSHQPSGPWPEGPAPNDVVSETRRCFPELGIGGGMLTNFTELNRCRPDPTICDFITFSSTAIVHASDDLSVCETLEALPQIFESAALLSKGKPVRLGLVSIGMRSNPYGTAIAENPDQVRITMAREDPRQRGLFAAAWAVGVLASTQGCGIEALCLAAPSGPFGVLFAPQSYPQRYYDETKEAIAYPLFHVVKAASAMSGQPRMSMTNLPDGVFAYGVEKSSGHKVMIANCTSIDTSIVLAEPAHVLSLDSQSFVDATQHTDWLEVTKKETTSQFELEAFGVAFVHFETPKH